MKFLWNIFILHVLGAFCLVFIVFTTDLIIGQGIDRELVGIGWFIVSLLSFITGSVFAGDRVMLFGDEMDKLPKIRLTIDK